MPGSKLKILIVDDETGLTESIKSALEETDRYDVQTANCGEDGISMAADMRPDLIFLDLIMPDLSGSDVAERLLGDPRTCDIPVVYLTAAITKAEATARNETGRSKFLPKPVTLGEVIACIEDRLGGERRDRRQEVLRAKQNEEEQTTLE